MVDVKSDIAGLLHQAVEALKREKKKSILLGILSVVACVLIARFLLSGSSPSQARAARSASSLIYRETVSDAPSNRDTQASAGGAGERPTRGDLFVRQKRQKLARDLFALNPEYFPLERSASPVKVLTPEGELEPGQADRNVKRQIVRAQARALTLQSTMISSDPTAIINGRVLQIGETINGFEVVEIAPHACKVRKSEVMIMLEMTK